MGKLSRTKGAVFERWVANQLKPIFPDAHRQPQSQIKLLKEISQQNPHLPSACLTDVVAGPLGIECKHRKVLPKFRQTLAQAQADIGGSGKWAVAVHKHQGGYIQVALPIEVVVKLSGLRKVPAHAEGDAYITMGWDDFLALCDSYAASLPESPGENGIEKSPI